MSDEVEFAENPDEGLDYARNLVARILEFVIADPGRLARFLKTTSFQPDTLEASVQSPLFMLSVLDSAIKDERLLHELQAHERIARGTIELTQARLAFHVTAELTKGSEDDARAAAVRTRVKHQLRKLLRVAQQK